MMKAPKDALKTEIILVIKDIFGVSMEPKDVDFRAGTIFIKTKDSALKNEIFIKKAKILEILSKKLGPSSPKDLRF